MKKRYWYTFAYTTSDGGVGNGNFASDCAKPTMSLLKEIIRQIKTVRKVDGVAITSIQRAN
ncbi:hypothetical protein ACX93W_26730 [Paenibacillus sp. CAU 1782]